MDRAVATGRDDDVDAFGDRSADRRARIVLARRLGDVGLDAVGLEGLTEVVDGPAA
jgi:hypothetical protein